jgi:hypothetical protein
MACRHGLDGRRRRLGRSSGEWRVGHGRDDELGRRREERKRELRQGKRKARVGPIYREKRGRGRDTGEEVKGADGLTPLMAAVSPLIERGKWGRKWGRRGEEGAAVSGAWRRWGDMGRFG